MSIGDEGAETLVICPQCVKSDGPHNADPDCKECNGSGLVSSTRAAELLSNSFERSAG